MGIAIARTVRPKAPPASLPDPDTMPALIVFGRDEAGKAHASWFNEAEVSLATKAAASMGLSSLELPAGGLNGVEATTLPRGKVFASGKAFVPFVKGAVYDQLAVHLPPAATQLHLRLVGAEQGTETEFEVDAEEPAASPAAGADLPKGWAKIKVGSLVLASEGHMNGWYEAVVIEDHGDDLLTLRWRDWPQEPTIERRRWHLALLHPASLTTD